MMMYTSSTSLSWELDRSVALFADVLLDEILVIPGGGPFTPGFFARILEGGVIRRRTVDLKATTVACT